MQPHALPRPANPSKVALPPSELSPSAAIGMAIVTLVLGVAGLVAGLEMGSKIGRYLGLGSCGVLAVGLYGLLGMRSRTVASVAYLIPALLTAPFALVPLGMAFVNMRDRYFFTALIIGLIASAPCLLFGAFARIQWRSRSPSVDWTASQVLIELGAFAVSLLTGWGLAAAFDLLT